MKNRTDGHRVRETRTRLGPELLILRILVVLGGLALGLALLQRAPRRSERYVIFVNPYAGHEIAHPASWRARWKGDGMSTTISQRLSDHIQLPHQTDRRPRGAQIRLESIDQPAEGGVEVEVSALATDRLGFSAVSRTVDRRRALVGTRVFEIDGPRYDGWGAAIIWMEDDALNVLSLYAPTREDFDRLQSTWDAVRGSAKPAAKRNLPTVEPRRNDPPAPPVNALHWAE